jgi:hypothetical protein
MTSACDSTLNTRLQEPGTAFSQWKAGRTSELNVATITAAKAQEALADITKTTACIQEKLTEVGGLAGSASAVQGRITELQTKLQKEREFVRIAKDRARMAQDGQQQPSYYDAWFPLGRPMKSGSVLLFTGLALFMLLIAFFLLLSFVGVDIQVFYQPLESTTLIPYWIKERFPLAFWLVLVAFIVTLVAALRR